MQKTNNNTCAKEKGVFKMQKKKGFLKKLLIGFAIIWVLGRISSMISGPTPPKKVVEEKPKQVVEAVKLPEIPELSPQEKLFDELEAITRTSNKDDVKITVVERNGGTCVFVSHEIDSFLTERSLFRTIMYQTKEMLSIVFNQSNLFDEFEYYVRVKGTDGKALKVASITLTRKKSGETNWKDILISVFPSKLEKLSTDFWIHPTFEKHIK